MSDDLERDLRAMLDERASDIRSVPAGLLLASDDAPAVPEPDDDVDGEVIELGLRMDGILAGARRRWPVLLAAAAVLAAVGSVLALLVGNPARHPAPPAHPAPKVKSVIRPSCTTAVPASWTRIVDRRAPVPHVGADDVVAVTPSGGLVLQFDGPTTSGFGTARFAYLAPGAGAPRSLGVVRVPLPHGLSSYEFDLDTDDSTLLVTGESGGHVAEPRDITAVDLHSGRHTVLARISGTSTRRIFNQAYVQDGTAYFQTDPRARTKGAAVHDRVVAVPVTGGAAHVVARGDVYLEKSALGIEWNTYEALPDRPADVPAVLTRHANILSTPNDVFDTYITDGDVYAWQTLKGALDWYDPKTGELVTVPHLLGSPVYGFGQSFLYSVAGPLVYYQARGAAPQDRVIDVRTGAVVRISQTGQLYGARGDVVGPQSVFTRTPGSSSALVAVHASDLPPAHC